MCIFQKETGNRKTVKKVNLYIQWTVFIVSNEQKKRNQSFKVFKHWINI